MCTGRLRRDRDRRCTQPQPRYWAPKLTIPNAAQLDPHPVRPGQQGVKAKASPRFTIQRDPQFPSVIQLIGIESPGLTSAPFNAEQLSDLVSEILA